MPKKKTVWEARDGTTHSYREHAEIYEGLLDLYEYVDLHPIYCGSTESSVDGQALGLWLKENPSIYMKYLHGGECPQGFDDIEKPPLDFVIAGEEPDGD